MGDEELSKYAAESVYTWINGGHQHEDQEPENKQCNAVLWPAAGGNLTSLFTPSPAKPPLHSLSNYFKRSHKFGERLLYKRSSSVSLLESSDLFGGEI